MKGDGEARTPPPPVVSAFAQGDGISVRVVVASGTNVRAAVYDVAGRSVRRLADGYVESGEHVVRWDARDESGKRVSSGVYFVRVQTGEGVATLRTVVTK
ncbi:MAG TPA: FlgD immunoglobulin-like domain containing protein [Gaiellales bacterium]|nr:FlgD immunoglobulin-like domain containing protein [Gaiellales bacterium]